MSTTPFGSPVGAARGDHQGVAVFDGLVEASRVEQPARGRCAGGGDRPGARRRRRPRPAQGVDERRPPCASSGSGATSPPSASARTGDGTRQIRESSRDRWGQTRRHAARSVPAPSGSRAWRVRRHPLRARRGGGGQRTAIAKITIDRPEVRNAFRPADGDRAVRRRSTRPGRTPRSASSSSPARATRRSARAATSGCGATPATSATTQLGKHGRRPLPRHRPARADPAHCRSRSWPWWPATRSAAATCSTSCATSRIAADNARFGQTGPKVGSFDGGFGAGVLRPPGRAEEGQGDLVPVPAVRRRSRRSTWAWSTRSCRSTELEEETVQWCREMLALSPFALRLLKASFNADEDGLAGIQQLAHDANLLFYGHEEAQEGREAVQGEATPGVRAVPARARERSGSPGPGPAPCRPRSCPSLVGTACAVGEVDRRTHLVAGRRRAGRRARPPGRHQLRQRLQRRDPRHRRRRARVGPVRLVGQGLAAPQAVKGRRSSRSASPAWPGWRWPSPSGRSCSWSARWRSRPAGSTPAGPALRLRRLRRGVRVRRSSASWPPPARPTCRPDELDGLSLGGVGAGRVPRHRAARRQQPARHPRRHRGRASGRWPSASGDRRTRVALHRAARRRVRRRAARAPGSAIARPAPLALIAVVLAQRAGAARARRARTGPALIPVLGDTGRVQLVFGVLFAAGLGISG